jgi:hypothetical protein
MDPTDAAREARRPRSSVSTMAGQVLDRRTLTTSTTGTALRPRSIWRRTRV